MIENTALAELCYLASKSEYIAFDTEFSRVKGHYYPVPSLLQFSFDGEKAYLCDLYDKKANWTPLIELLTNNKIIKVFHAVKQDLDVLEKAFQIRPQRIFDIQLAAGFLGHYSSPGYHKLVKDFLGVNLNKDMQFSNWTQRPLSQGQLIYAASDVTHLFKLFPRIREALSSKYSWAEEEMKELTNQNKNSVLSYLEKIALTILMDNGTTLTPQAIWYLNQLLLWRENEVFIRNRLREKILPSSRIKKIILAYQRGVTSKVNQKFIAIFATLPENLKEEASLLELLIKKKDILLFDNKLYKELRSLLKITSQKSSIEKGLIARKSDLLEIAARGLLTKKFQEGWRYEIFGEAVEKCL